MVFLRNFHVYLNNIILPVKSPFNKAETFGLETYINKIFRKNLSTYTVDISILVFYDISFEQKIVQNVLAVSSISVRAG